MEEKIWGQITVLPVRSRRRRPGRRGGNGNRSVLPLVWLLLFFFIGYMIIGTYQGVLRSGTETRQLSVKENPLSAAGGNLKKRLVSMLTRQTAELAGRFWYPAAFLDMEEARREGDADPSYQSYLEWEHQLEEYERLVRALEENSLLFQNSRTGADNGAADGVGAGKKLAAGAGFEAAGENEAGTETGGETGTEAGREAGTWVQPGTAAGEALLGHQAGSEKGIRYLAEQLADYDYLMKHFYTVHPTAAAGRDLMRAADFLETDCSLENSGMGSEEVSETGTGANPQEPQILIYHTHSQEEYADYHQGNQAATIGNVGEYLKELLEQKGYRVLHDTSVYDFREGKLDRSRAYSYALEGVTAILQEYPSIEVVLDLHRDGVSENTRLVTEVNGKQTASIMFFNGTSETPDGPIEYLANPYRTENLAFSFQMKLCAEALYPGFTRNIYLKGLRYNLHLRPRSALVEVGAQNNTYEEALNAMEPLSELLDMVLKPRG